MGCKIKDLTMLYPIHKLDNYIRTPKIIVDIKKEEKKKQKEERQAIKKQLKEINEIESLKKEQDLLKIVEEKRFEKLKKKKESSEKKKLEREQKKKQEFEEKIKLKEQELLEKISKKNEPKIIDKNKISEYNRSHYNRHLNEIRHKARINYYKKKYIINIQDGLQIYRSNSVN